MKKAQAETSTVVCQCDYSVCSHRSSLSILVLSDFYLRASNFPAGLGIQNLGNTCYVASALHALAATPALLDLLQAGGAVETATTPIADAVGHILVQLHTLYDAARVVSVKPLLNALSSNRVQVHPHVRRREDAEGPASGSASPAH